LKFILQTLLVLLAISPIIDPAIAATNPAKKFSQIPFTPIPDEKKFSGDYFGNDTSCIYNQAMQLSKYYPPERDKYERTDDYQARSETVLEKLNQHKFCGELTLDQFFGIDVHVDKEYDPDTEQLTLTARTSNGNTTGCGISISNKNTKGKSYIGSNSFGVKKTISVTFLTEKFLAEKYNNSCAGNSSISKVKMSVEDAKRHHYILARLYGKLAPPFFTEADDESSPTMSNPVHSYTKTYNAITDWRGIIFYNLVTREIISRVDL
jgi:hypothetical protein